MDGRRGPDETGHVDMVGTDDPTIEWASDAGSRESGLVQRTGNRLRAQLGRAVPHVLAGVSGGADSVALLTVLSDLAGRGTLTLSVVHVDHGARPRSGEDAAFVAAHCERLGVTCRVVRLAAGADRRHPGVGAEESWRRERYRAFATVADEVGAGFVALAHHRQDQAETVLLHLFRGSGLRGVSGMAEWSSIRIPWWTANAAGQELAIWRPFLDEDPLKVREFLGARGIAWREDASNLDPAFRRNAVRASVLPAIDAVFPGAATTIARFAEVARVDDKALDALAASWIEGHVRADGLDRAALGAVHRGIGRRVVRRWIAAHADPIEVSLERIDAVLDAVARGAGRRIEIGGGWRVAIERKWLVIVRPEDPRGPG